MNFKELIFKSIPLIRQTGQFLKKQQSKLKASDIREKSPSNLVTSSDTAAEKMLVKGLKRILPQAGFLTEEGTITPKQNEFMWIIDPLDGTTNYVHGMPIFS